MSLTSLFGWCCGKQRAPKVTLEQMKQAFFDEIAAKLVVESESPTLRELLFRQREVILNLYQLPDTLIKVAARGVTIECNGLRVSLSDDDDFGVYKEIFKELYYNLLLPEVPFVVIDAGANIGLATLYFLSRGAAFVFAYEPFPVTFSQAEFNLNQNPQFSGKFELSCVGLSDVSASGKFEFDLQRKSGSSTMHQQKSPGVDRAASEPSCQEIVEVKLIAADEMLEKIVKRFPNHLIVLKMDIEGSEERVMRCLNQSPFFDKISCVAIEWHGNSLGHLASILRSQGYAGVALPKPGNLYGLVYAVKLLK